MKAFCSVLTAAQTLSVLWLARYWRLARSLLVWLWVLMAVWLEKRRSVNIYIQTRNCWSYSGCNGRWCWSLRWLGRRTCNRWVRPRSCYYQDWSISQFRDVIWLTLGVIVGVNDGTYEGELVKTFVGSTLDTDSFEGAKVGSWVGSLVGFFEGLCDGLCGGVLEGAKDGSTDGSKVSV